MSKEKIAAPPELTAVERNTFASITGIGEYDEETVERVHQENIRKSKEALEASKSLNEVTVEYHDQALFGIQPTEKPRRVFDNEISEYQGVGGKKQFQRSQSRKRRQVRNHERSVWSSIAPKKYHAFLNLIYFIVFALGLLIVFSMNGLL